MRNEDRVPPTSWLHRLLTVAAPGRFTAPLPLRYHRPAELTMRSRTRAQFGVLVGIAAMSLAAIVPIAGQQTPPPPTAPVQQTPPAGARQGGQGQGPNFEAALARQVQTD